VLQLLATLATLDAHHRMENRSSGGRGDTVLFL
jgi:hypothetical protein